MFYHSKKISLYQLNGIMNESNNVKGIEFIKPEIDEVDYVLDKVIKDCN